MITYKLNHVGSYAAKIVDGIPVGESHNTESSQEYLKWLEAGNTPEPAEEQQ